MATPRLTRRQWGAVAVSASRRTLVPSTRGSATHWVGGRVWPTSGVMDHAQCAAKLRGIQRSHMAGEWYDVAYNEAVCPHGTRYELRGYNVQTGANGSSFANRNWYAILALVGKGDKITPALLAGLYDAHEAYRVHGDAGADTTTHRALMQAYRNTSTECCGDELIGHVKAGRFRHRSTPTPSPTPTLWKDPSMKPVLVRVEGTDPVYLSGDRVTRRWVRDAKDLATVRADMAAVGASTTIRVVSASAINHYGVLVGPAPVVGQ